MKTAKILAGVAIGIAVIGIGVTVFLHFKKNNNTVTTRVIETDLDTVVE